MKINCIKKLPKKVCIAFSGGIDSVVMAHIAIELGRDVTLLFYHHGNTLADNELNFANEFASQFNVPLIIEYCSEEISGSKEKFWRDSRYKFFKSFDETVVTGHHLDDAVNWYLMTCLRGRGEFMEYSHANVCRPMLLTKKCDIINYATKHNLNFYTDETNSDVKFTQRNAVNLELLPKCLEINPGLYTVVKNRILQKIKGE